MSYDMVVGRGARNALATPLASPPDTWLHSEARDYDPSYYQALYKRVGAGFVNARVYAALGASLFTVQLHDDRGWQAWDLGASEHNALGALGHELGDDVEVAFPRFRLDDHLGQFIAVAWQWH